MPNYVWLMYCNSDSDGDNDDDDGELMMTIVAAWLCLRVADVL